MSEERAVNLEDLVFIHSAAVARCGGASGIRDDGSLEATVSGPHASFGGQEMFPGPFAKESALMESLIQRHPFVDGNKRTGTAAAVYLLRRRGYRLRGVTDADLSWTWLSLSRLTSRASKSSGRGSRGTPKPLERAEKELYAP